MLDCRPQRSRQHNPQTIECPPLLHFLWISTLSILEAFHFYIYHFPLVLCCVFLGRVPGVGTEQRSTMPISPDSSSSDFEHDDSESNPCFSGGRAAKVPADQQSPSRSLGGVFASYRRRKGTVFKTLRMGGKGDVPPLPVSLRSSTPSCLLGDHRLDL